AFLADGVACTGSFQCQSANCVSGFCRTVPLADGQVCTSNLQCQSGFCGLEATRICTRLPLANDATCTLADQCMSGVCYQNRCVSGLPQGDPCTAGLTPCASTLYCNPEVTPSVCAPRHLTGQDCTSSLQCYGTCGLRFGRMMCDRTQPRGTVICDGN